MLLLTRPNRRVEIDLKTLFTPQTARPVRYQAVIKERRFPELIEPFGLLSLAEGRSGGPGDASWLTALVPGPARFLT